MVRQRVAISGIVSVVALLSLLVFPAACRQVPDTTLNNNDNSGDAFDAPAMAVDAANAFQETPRTLERVRISASMYEKAFEKDEPRTYENLWKAARTCAWLAEYSPDDVERERMAKTGITYANTALKLQPDGREGLFYHAVLAGFLGDLDNSYGLDAVKKIEESMTKLIEADFDIAGGGPWRVYGVLQIRAPGPPVSVGSLRNGRKNLQLALDKAPEWPENHLYMAEAEFMWAKERDKPEFAQQAKDRLNQWLLGEEATAPEGYEFEFEHWKQLATDLQTANS